MVGIGLAAASIASVIARRVEAGAASAATTSGAAATVHDLGIHSRFNLRILKGKDNEHRQCD